MCVLIDIIHIHVHTNTDVVYIESSQAVRNSTLHQSLEIQYFFHAKLAYAPG